MIDTIKLKDILLSNDMMTAQQISAYVNELSIENKYIHISGDSNIGKLELSSDLIVNGNIKFGQQTKTLTTNSLAFGINTQAGVRAFKIVSFQKDQYGKGGIITINGTDLEYLVGDIYSVMTSGPALKCGTVLSTSENNGQTTLSVSNLIRNIYMYGADNIFFMDHQDIGDIVVGTTAMAIGNSTLAAGDYSLAEGYSTAAGKYGHAEGRDTAADWGSHAEGDHTRAFTCIGHVEGRSNYTDQYVTHVEGLGNWISCGGSENDSHIKAGGSHVAGIAATSKHSFAFVWSGENRPDENGNMGAVNYDRWYRPVDPYCSHGNGTFNINPLSGLSGFYIGEQSLASILDGSSSDISSLSSMISSVSCIAEDLISSKADVSALVRYVTEDELDSRNYLISDDVNISYSDQTIWLSSKSHVTSVDCADFIKDGMLSSVQLCGTVLQLEFSTESGSDPISVDLSVFVDNYNEKIGNLSSHISQKILISNDISGTSCYSDLSIFKLHASDYESLLTSDQLLSNALYVVEDCYINAYGEQIKNLSEPTDLSDATTKEYVDNSISSIQMPTDLSAFTNSPGYLKQHQSLSDYYKKSETSSAADIQAALSHYAISNDVQSLVESLDESINSITAVIPEDVAEDNKLVSQDSIENYISESPTVSSIAYAAGKVIEAVSSNVEEEQLIDNVSCIINEYINYNGTIVSAASTSYSASYHTDYIALSSFPYYRYRITTSGNSPIIYGLYNEEKQFISAGPKAPTNVQITIEGLLSTDTLPNDAAYIMFSTFSGGTLDVRVPKTVVVNEMSNLIDNVRDINESIDVHTSSMTDMKLFTVFSETAGYYINRRPKSYQSSPAYKISTPIPIVKGRIYHITTINANVNNVSRYAFIDGNSTLLSIDTETGTPANVPYEQTIDCNKVIDNVPLATNIIICDAKAHPFIIAYSDTSKMTASDSIYAVASNACGKWTELSVELSSGYLDFNSRNIASSDKAKYTELLEIKPGEKYKHSGASYGNVCTYAIYDISGNWLTCGGYDPDKKFLKTIDEIIDCNETINEFPTAKYIRFCSYGQEFYYPYVQRFQTDLTDLKSVDEKIDDAQSSNFLYGRKWIVCGDSFTTPDMSENDFDPQFICEKSYQYFIRKRNSMKIVEPGRSGEAMSWNPHSPSSDKRSHFCSKVEALSNEISSADYITFMYGLNEQKPSQSLSSWYANAMNLSGEARAAALSVYLSSLISQNETFELSSYFIGDAIGHPAQVSDIVSYEDLNSYVFPGTIYGQKEDTEVSTVFGAWNYVLSTVYTYNPLIRAGIIITDGGIGQQQYDIQLSIASWWGIPVLDLDRDKHVPLMIGGKTGQDINPFVRDIRTAAMARSLSDKHPTKIGHEYRSTIIENFLRTI